jgi:hypothetical protein
LEGEEGGILSLLKGVASNNIVDEVHDALPHTTCTWRYMLPLLSSR